MAYCSSCGTPINDNEEYCSNCKPAETYNELKHISEQSEYISQKNKTNSIFWPIISIVLILALVGVTIYLTTEFKKEIQFEVQTKTETVTKTISTTLYDTKTVPVLTDSDKALIIAEGKVSELEEKLEKTEKELAEIKDNYAKTAAELITLKETTINQLETDLYNMRHLKSFDSEKELDDFLYYDDTERNKQLSAVNKGYVIYTKLTRMGYWASFMVENTNTMELTGSVYVYIKNSGIYAINPVKDSFYLVRPKESLESYYQLPDDYDYITIN